MFQGQKITAITFCGRKRYMDLLTPHIIREHDRGLIDKWLLFNNIRTNVEDATYAQQLKDHLPWSEVINRPPVHRESTPGPGIPLEVGRARERSI